MKEKISRNQLAALLEEKHNQYNTPDFIEEDPISIPHRFDRKEDIEIAGFLTALIAWGRRTSIINNAIHLMKIMDMAPYEYVMNAVKGEMAELDEFVHRTFNGTDCQAILLSLRNVYQNHGGLEGLFSKGIHPAHENVFHTILFARDRLISLEDFPLRSQKHIANPGAGSSAKRINMFLRWMVRNDRRGVDFGLWKNIFPHQLICPLDVHTGNVARKLGLLIRTQNDWKAAAELTANLRAFCPEDPVKYDFSLFGLGVYEGF
ncbi:MAG: TIGR02757 family protein [Bacteroidia bacterium]|nr:TIGR02757 family protein [Bacteroidia bacterium]